MEKLLKQPVKQVIRDYPPSKKFSPGFQSAARIVASAPAF